ncbi:peroxide stress protein YaaA [Algoriphagus sp.]|uniref:peroxide stress protein YaaA n=1 Tax=Algoriphagus sp. TaxID=1872435 RepID=UPI00391BE7D8
MLILISPAKTLDYSIPNFKDYTHPEFASDIKALVNVMKKKSALDISKLMDVSENLAALNEERYKTFQKEFNTDNSKQALLAFKGDVYTKIDVDNYSQVEFDFAQNHLRILSGLYGLLKPLDLIQPYRLEMGTRLVTKKGKNLYEFWGTKIAKAIKEASKGDTIINLASQEYFKAVELNTLKSSVINIHFKEFKSGKYQTIGLFAKQARGMMTDFAIKNKIIDPDILKTFNQENYEFSTELSNNKNWFFIR